MVYENSVDIILYLSIILSMKYDISQARLAYDSYTGNYGAANFAQFSPAYAQTNEDVREIFWTLAPKPGMHVLTVAGSGDQALRYKMAGAAHVDTFDITFNAKMMMDIKTTAIQKLSRADYVELINSVSRIRNIADIPQYQKIAEFLPEDTRQYIQNMCGARLVRGGLYFETLYNDEYAKLQKLITKPFNFIWTDLSELSTHLTQQYDHIYLSNILQYRPEPGYVTPLILNLTRFLKPGGLIVVNVVPFFVGQDIEVIRHLKRQVEAQGIGTVKMIHNHFFDMCVLQKR